MKTNTFLRFTLLFSIVCCLFACNNRNDDPKESEPTFEDRLCHKWECWQIQTGNALNPIDSATTYVTFLRDGKLLFENVEMSEVQIYSWQKLTESEIVTRFPVPAGDLGELNEMLSTFGIDELSFVDTISVNAIIKELTDTTLVLLGNIELGTILTQSAIDRLSKSELTQGILLIKMQYQLYMRKSEKE